MIALDTNILIYAHVPQFGEHKPCYKFLTNLLESKEDYGLSWQVCYEYFRVMTHPKILGNPLSAKEALQDIDNLLDQSHCQILGELQNHRDELRATLKSIPQAKGNFLHDCHYAVLLKENGVSKIATTDADYRRFDFLKIINPLAEPN